MAYCAVVSSAAVLMSWLVIAAPQGDSESKSWLLYGWRLVLLPATLVLGFVSVVAYDWFSRIRRVRAKLALVVANAVTVAAIPYLVGLAVGLFGSR